MRDEFTRRTLIGRRCISKSTNGFKSHCFDLGRIGHIPGYVNTLESKQILKPSRGNEVGNDPVITKFCFKRVFSVKKIVLRRKSVSDESSETLRYSYSSISDCIDLKININMYF